MGWREFMNPSVQKALKSGFAVWTVAAICMLAYLYKYGLKDIKYGIDLVGGTYITLEVQEDDVIKNYLNDKVRNFESLLKSSKIEIDGNPLISNKTLTFKFNSPETAKEAETLLREKIDKDLKELAEEELRESSEKLIKIEEELRFLLLPKDPNDDKNVIMEIRGGAGGDEAALFEVGKEMLGE